MASATRERDAESPQVSGVLLRVIAASAAPHGVTPEHLLGDSLRAFETCDPIQVRVPLQRYRDAWLRAVALTGKPALPLQGALRTADSAFDVLAPLIAHVPTLRDALQTLRTFQALAFEGLEIRKREALGIATLHVEFPRAHGEADRCIAEFVVAGLWRLLQTFGCTRAELHSACFEHPRPRHAATYAEAFAGAERFGADHTGLSFPVALLDRPHLHSNPTLQRAIQDCAERHLACVARGGDIRDRLRSYLRNQPAHRVPDMVEAARGLGISERSLRRRLAEDGLSYRELTKALHRERACDLLRDPHLEPQTVAGVLGFRDVSAFRRAFKRWTGMSTTEYRASSHTRTVH